MQNFVNLLWFLDLECRERSGFMAVCWYSENLVKFLWVKNKLIKSQNSLVFNMYGVVSQHCIIMGPENSV